MRKKKHFYSHLIEVDSLHIELDSLELSIEEKHELTVLMDTTIHHTVMDTVLTELPEDGKKELLKHLLHENHDEIWKLLKQKVTEPEEKIKKAVHSLKKELHEDIKESKKKKKLHEVEHRND